MKSLVGVNEVRFASHAEAVTVCRSCLEPWFDLHEEVELGSGQISTKGLRIDLLAVPRTEDGYLIGIEIKPGFYRMSEYSAAIKQAADYRLGAISDPRLSHLAGRRVSAAFVFPRWHGGHDKAGEYGREAAGMEILAHHFRIGAAAYKDGAVSLSMNNQTLWASGIWSGNAANVLGGKERVGSLRVIDPARGT